jgi:hypothetical protein
MARKLALVLLLLGTVCLMPHLAGSKAEATSRINCSSTCTAAARRQCAVAGGFCGYNPDFGGCGCVYP